jgi:hypothetical protein
VSVERTWSGREEVSSLLEDIDIPVPHDVQPIWYLVLLLTQGLDSVSPYRSAFGSIGKKKKKKKKKECRNEVAPD